MRLGVLGSGSKGNGTLVADEKTSLLVDCGFSVRNCAARAAALNFNPQSINAILISHEHDDHLRGATTLARRFDIPIYATRGTQYAARERWPEAERWLTFSPHTPFQIGSFRVEPIAVPHDAREPCQFVIANDNFRVGLLTDLGEVTTHIRSSYRDCDALLLEFNHDPSLLSESRYPEPVRRRIQSNYGHLSNAQACALIAELRRARRLQHVVAVHLSQQTNLPRIVAEALAGTDPALSWDIASQDNVLPWVSLS